MSNMKICVLAVAAAFAAPVLAQKAPVAGGAVMAAPKASIKVEPAIKLEAVKTEVAIPAPVQTPKAVQAISPATAIMKTDVPVLRATPGKTEGSPATAKETGLTPELRPTAVGKDPSGAGFSTADIKQNIDMKGLDQQNAGGSLQDVKARMLGLGDLETKPGSRTSVLGGGQELKSAGARLKDELGDAGPVTGSNRDTFGGGRINDRQGNGGGTRNFSGGGKGNSSMDDGERTIIGVGAGKEDTGESREQFGKTVAGMLTGEGGKSSGNSEKDTAELGYAQSVGTDGYAATKNMSQSERKAYWTDQKNKQQNGKSTPREDDMGGGNSGPMGRQDVVTTQRGLAGRLGGAGGKDDGRTDQQSTTGGVGGVIARDRAEGAQREAGTGTLNVDAVLEINTLVNPGAR